MGQQHPGHLCIVRLSGMGKRFGWQLDVQTTAFANTNAVLLYFYERSELRIQNLQINTMTNEMKPSHLDVQTTVFNKTDAVFCICCVYSGCRIQNLQIKK